MLLAQSQAGARFCLSTIFFFPFQQRERAGQALGDGRGHAAPRLLLCGPQGPWEFAFGRRSWAQTHRRKPPHTQTHTRSPPGWAWRAGPVSTLTLCFLPLEGEAWFLTPHLGSRWPQATRHCREDDKKPHHFLEGREDLPLCARGGCV